MVINTDCKTKCNGYQYEYHYDYHDLLLGYGYHNDNDDNVKLNDNHYDEFEIKVI